MSGSVIYRIDAEDRIREVSEEWMRFAEENGGDPDPAAVLGRCLWDFIPDEGNRRIYRCIVDAVRRNAKPIQVPFRCDSPSVERHMTMTVAPGNMSEVAFICALQYAFDRPPQPVGGRRRDSLTIVACDGCQRLWSGRAWRACWEVIRDGDIVIDERPINVLRTCCAACGADRAARTQP
jgi:hypothetical protein